MSAVRQHDAAVFIWGTAPALGLHSHQKIVQRCAASSHLSVLHDHEE